MSPTTSRVSRTPPPADDPVALRIRTLRLSQGLSYKRLSEAAGGLATSFLFNIEHGRKVPGEEVAARIEDGEHNPSLETMTRLCDALGLELTLTIGPKQTERRVVPKALQRGVHDATDQVVVSVREC